MIILKKYMETRKRDYKKTIHHFARSLYNGQLSQFNRDEESYKNICKELISKGEFISYNNI